MVYNRHARWNVLHYHDLYFTCPSGQHQIESPIKSYYNQLKIIPIVAYKCDYVSIQIWNICNVAGLQEQHLNSFWPEWDRILNL